MDDMDDYARELRDEHPEEWKRRRVQIWKCEWFVWHYYVPESDSPTLPCQCGTWDHGTLTWEAALKLANYKWKSLWE